MITQHKQFHVSAFPASANWPNGGYSLYEITGDQIAKTIGFASDGRVERRDGWPGYLGTVATTREIAAIIEDCIKS